MNPGDPVEGTRDVPSQDGAAQVVADMRPNFRRQASQILGQLPPEEKQSLIIKCWMSHDARWFTAVATEFGLDAAIRLNRVAVREEGRVEARRLVRRLQLPAVRTLADDLLIQEVFIGLLGPDLLDYRTLSAGKSGSTSESKAVSPLTTSVERGSQNSTSAVFSLA